MGMKRREKQRGKLESGRGFGGLRHISLGEEGKGGGNGGGRKGRDAEEGAEEG